MSLKMQPCFFLDLQTTGAKPDGSHILEIAWGALSQEKIYSSLVQQPEETPIPKRIQFITGISQEDLASARALTDVLLELQKFIESFAGANPVAIIHFAQFEKAFLIDAYEKLQQTVPFKIVCTHEIAKRLFPNLPTRGIKGLAGYFGCPSGELKRATGHVLATQMIWQGLTKTLDEKGVTSWNQLEEWLNETPKAKRGKYEYPLPKEKRLSLPKQPGVYRMISRWGEVLYVGKATSLHDRVNSYFRGQKNRDSFKLEMLTQVWDLKVTPVGSPLEAALLETDEIKRLNPPYNISLKVGSRELVFFNKDFTSNSPEADSTHTIGPFSNIMALDSILRLSASLKTEVFDENMFYEVLSPELIKNGFEVFCARHGLVSDKFKSVRSILALGLLWYRRHLKEVALEESEELESQEELDTEADEALEEEIEMTPELLADRFERHFMRSAANYRRSKLLTKLLNAEIQITGKENIQLQVTDGLLSSSTPSAQRKINPWQNHSVDTYDRMTVLNTELNKLKSKGCEVRLLQLSSAAHRL